MATFRPRSELKYLLREEQVPFVRELASFFLARDAHGEDGCYAVESLYLDTADWKSAFTTDEGFGERFKLRIRRYADDPSSPFYCEIKEKLGGIILKQRSTMTFDDTDGILRGAVPSERGFSNLIAEEKDSLIRFRNLMDTFDMRPRLWVRYEREAWTSSFGDDVRITFDRCVEVQPPSESAALEPHSSWVNASTDPPVILELKFTGAAPRWMQQLVRAGNLHRQSASKYGSGARLLGATPFAATHGGCAWNP